MDIRVTISKKRNKITAPALGWSAIYTQFKRKVRNLPHGGRIDISTDNATGLTTSISYNPMQGEIRFYTWYLDEWGRIVTVDTLGHKKLV